MINYLLNGVVCNPLERQAIKYKAVFDGRRFGEFDMTVTNLTFVREDKAAIEAWINTYGYGVAMPFDVQFSNNFLKSFFLDFSSIKVRENSISCDARVRYDNDNFFSKADGLTFTPTSSLVYQAGDIININFLVIDTEQSLHLISVSLATIVFAKEVAESVERIGDVTNAGTKALTPVGIPPGPDWGAIIILGIKIALKVAYTIAIIIALVKMIIDIVMLVFPPIRKFRGVDVYRLLQRSCASIGYTFSSNFLQSNLQNLTILPAPLMRGGRSFFQAVFIQSVAAFTKGYPTSKDTVATLGQLISFLENTFNLRTRVINGNVVLEHASFFAQNATAIEDAAFNVQKDIENEYTINLNEIPKRKVFIWDVDPADFNTYDDTYDSIVEFNTSAASPPAADLDLIKGYEEVRVPFSRATRKDSLTAVELAVKGLASVADVFTGGNASGLISSRKQVMQISQLFFQKTKLLIRTGENLSQTQRDVIGCSAIAAWHDGTFGQNQLKKIFTDMPVRMNEAQFLSYLQNNYINLTTGQQIEIIAIDWSEENNLASVDYRENIIQSHLLTTQM